MRNRIAVIVCVLVLIIPCMLAACTAAPATPASKPSEDNTSQAPQQEPLSVRCAVSYPQNHPFCIVGNIYSQLTEEATEGRVKIVMHYSQSLCPAADELSAAHSGSIDAAVSVASYLVGQVPIANLGVLPWVGITDVDNSVAATMEVLPIMQKAFEKYNVYLTLYAPFASGYGLATKKEVQVPEDAKGLKIRSGGGALDELVSGWGCATVSIPTSEMYQSIQRGICDGTVLTSTSVKSYNLYEITPYFCDFDCGLNAFTFYFSRKTWDKISTADQKAITDTTKALVTKINTLNKVVLSDARVALPKQGIEVYVPTADEIKLWKAPAKGIWDNFMASSPEAKQAADIFIKYGAGY